MDKEGCEIRFIQIGKTCLTKDAIKKMFITEAKKVWPRSSLIDDVNLKVSLQDCKGYLALVRNRNSKPYAIGDHLIQTPKKVTLKVCNNLKKIDIKEFKKLLGHEALHMGYPRHDNEFRAVAKEKGIPVSLNEMQGGKVELRGKRPEDRFYSHIGYFRTKSKAEEYARDHKKGFPYKWEIRY